MDIDVWTWPRTGMEPRMLLSRLLEDITLSLLLYATHLWSCPVRGTGPLATPFLCMNILEKFARNHSLANWPSILSGSSGSHWAPVNSIVLTKKEFWQGQVDMWEAVPAKIPSCIQLLKKESCRLCICLSPCFLFFFDFCFSLLTMQKLAIWELEILLKAGAEITIVK